MKANTGNKKLDYQIERAFQKYAEKFNLLDIEKSNLEFNTLGNATPLTEKHLKEQLESGEFLYWDLKRDSEGNILKVKSYSQERVMTNLHRKGQVEIEDTFADFAARM
jgi:hypothetical protein